MNIKEAMDDLYICATGAKYNTPTLGVGYYEKCWETVLNELDKKDKVIDMMAEYIEEWIGSCPNDMYDWQEIDCEKVCDNSMKQCWIEYFYNKIGGNIDKK